MTLFSAMTDDVRRFLVLRDVKGKTQVHEWNCEYLGKQEKFSCGCPIRLAVVLFNLCWVS